MLQALGGLASELDSHLPLLWNVLGVQYNQLPCGFRHTIGLYPLSVTALQVVAADSSVCVLDSGMAMAEVYSGWLRLRAVPLRGGTDVY